MIQAWTMAIKKELKIGIFVIVILIATFVVINILRGIDIFGREIKVYGHFEDVGTLVASAPVQIRGYAAGRVNSVEYDEETDKFVVECSIDKRFKIPTDSRLILYSTSIMGGKGVRVDYGIDKEFISDGAEMQVGEDAELISDLSDGIGSIVTKFSKLADSLQITISGVNAVLSNENRGNINASIQHLNNTLASAQAVASSIEGKSEELENIIANLNTLSNKLSPLADSAQETMDNVAGISKKLNNSDIEGTMKNVNSAIIKINDTVDNLSSPLDSLLNNADSLIKAIKNDPKKYIKVTIF